MVCPNCGAQNEAGAKFCADCGNKLADVAPVAAPVIPPATPMPGAQALPAAPPPWAQPAPAAPAQAAPPPQMPAPQVPPPWSQPPAQASAPTPPPWAAQAPQQPQQPPRPAQSPVYAQQPPQSQQPPVYAQQPQQPYPPQGYAPQPAYAPQGYAVASAAPNVAPIGPILAIAGGAIAIASGWLPWESAFGLTITPMDASVTSRTSDLANGYYLVAAGAVALLAGLALFLKLARTSGAVTLLALVAIVAGCVVLAVEAVAYSDMSESLKFATLGYGLYVGIAGGAVAIAGGAMALRKAR